MRRLRWIILIGELVMLALVLAVPPMDQPQTAFDEADTPINQATVPVVLSCRSALAGLRSAAKVTTALIDPPATHSFIALQRNPLRALRSRSLVTLFCAFLC